MPFPFISTGAIRVRAENQAPAPAPFGFQAQLDSPGVRAQVGVDSFGSAPGEQTFLESLTNWSASRGPAGFAVSAGPLALDQADVSAAVRAPVKAAKWIGGEVVDELLPSLPPWAPAAAAVAFALFLLK